VTDPVDTPPLDLNKFIKKGGAPPFGYTPFEFESPRVDFKNASDMAKMMLQYEYI
jgi:hypothetical protein